MREDFSKRVATARKNLWNSTAEERKTGAKVTWAFDKIKVNNVLYAWDEVNSRRYAFPASVAVLPSVPDND